MAKRLPDYTTLKVRHGNEAPSKGKRKKTPRDTSDVASFWWAAARGEDATAAKAHLSVWAATESVLKQQMERREWLRLWAALYGDKQAMRALGVMPSKTASTAPRVTLNLCDMAVETLGSKIARNRPRATIATEGGDWGMRRKAKGLDKFIQGIMYKARAYKVIRRNFKDSCVFDLGVRKWYREGGDIKCERVHPEEILVDETDARMGEPRCLYQVKSMHREVVRAWVDAMLADGTLSDAEHAHLQAAVDEAEAPEPLYSSTTSGARTDLGDMVEVREAWHLPSAKCEKGKPTDGRHVVAISGATLVDEEYRRPRFPFTFLPFTEELTGFYGRGAVERLVGWQRTINGKMQRINEALRLMAAPQYWQQTGDTTPMQSITNEIGIILRGARKPELLNTGIVVPPQLIDSVREDIQRALESVGVNEASVAARKPAGLDSRVAIREMSDQQSERFILVGQTLEESVLEDAEHIIDLAHEAAEEGHPIEAPVDDKRKGLQMVRWKDVNMERDAFVLKAFPTSSLPSTPAARKQAVEEWQQAGWIDANEARRLMDVPDLEASNNIAFAAAEDIDATIERFLEEGDDEDPESVYETPEPYQDLVYGLKAFQSALLRGRNQKVPEPRLELLRRWMEQAQAMLDKATAAAAPPPAPTGAAPAAPMPGAPPLAA